MKAAWYGRAGTARDVLRVGDLPDPEPATGEVLVRVSASGVNPSDYKRRHTVEPPPGTLVVPHSDGAGIVVGAGAGVDRTWLGQRVWVWNAVNRHGYGSPAANERGTAAELVAIPLEYVGVLPDTVGLDVGACLGVPAFTAYAAVCGGGEIAGRTVLVQGGAGAVGELAVQLARDAGATVIATVSSPSKAERARRAGAHYIVNYRHEDVRERVLTIAPGGVDLIVEVDFAANVRLDAEVLAPYGTIASFSSPSSPEAVIPYFSMQLKGASIRTVQVFTMPSEQRSLALQHISDALTRGVLRPSIAATFPLHDIVAAHEAAETHPEGQVLVTVPPEHRIRSAGGGSG